MQLSDEINRHMFDSVLHLQRDTMSQLERPSNLAPFKSCTMQDTLLNAHVWMMRMLRDAR